MAIKNLFQSIQDSYNKNLRAPIKQSRVLPEQTTTADKKRLKVRLSKDEATNDWFKQRTQEAGGAGGLIKKAGSGVVRGFSNVFSPGAFNQARSGSSLFRNVEEKPGPLDDISRFAGNYTRNVLDVGEKGIRDIQQGTQRVFGKGNNLLTRGSGVAKTLYGGANVVLPFTGTGKTINTLTSYPKQLGRNDFVRRTAQGALSGMSQADLDDSMVGSKKIKIGKLEFDPAKKIGEMYGYTQNPINKKIFGDLEKTIPTAGVGSKILRRGIRGSLEDLFLGFSNIPDTDIKDQARFIASQMGSGAVSEIIFGSLGEGVEAVAKKATPVLKDVASSTLDLFKKTGIDISKGVREYAENGFVKSFLDSVSNAKNQTKLKLKSLTDNLVTVKYKKLSDGTFSPILAFKDQLWEESKFADGQKMGKLFNSSDVPKEFRLDPSKEKKLINNFKQLGFAGDGSKLIKDQIDKVVKTAKKSEKKIEINQERLKDSTKTNLDIIEDARSEIGEIKDRKGKTLTDTIDEARTDWIDSMHPIVKAAKAVKGKLKLKGAEIRPEYDPEILIRRFYGQGGISNYQYKYEFEPIIREAQDAGINYKDLDAYLKAKRDYGFGEIGRDIKGSDPIKAGERIQAFKDMYGDAIENISNKIYDYQNKIFNNLVESGFISKEGADTIRKNNPYYVPFKRVMEEIDEYIGPTKSLQPSKVIEKIKGSKRQIVSPIQSIIENTYKYRNAIEKNNVVKSVAELAEIDPEIGFKPTRKAGKGTISYFENGVKKHMIVGEEIARSIKGLNSENINAVLKLLRIPANILRTTATGKNIDFFIPNAVRDQQDAVMNSKFGYVPFVNYIKGLAHLIKFERTGEDEIVEMFFKSGASQDLGIYSSTKQIKKQLSSAQKKKRIFDWLDDIVGTLGKYSETPTRIGLFENAYKKTGNPTLAMFEAREGSMDFARMGAKMKVANSIIPFLNVQIQGFERMVNNIKNNPKKTAALYIIYGVVPQILTTLYNMVNHRDEYDEIPDYKKDTNFVFINGRNSDGTIDYVTIPKGNTISLVANPIDKFIEWMAGNDVGSFKALAYNFLSDTVPVLESGASLKEIGVRTIGGLIPQAVSPLFENVLNKSFFRTTAEGEAKDIVPQYLKNKEPWQQTFEHTPRIYKQAGKVLNVSPLQIQHLLEGYFSGFVKVPVNILEVLVDASEKRQVNKNQIPVVRRFFARTYQTSDSKKTATGGTSKLAIKQPEEEKSFLSQVGAAAPGQRKKLPIKTEFSQEEISKAQQQYIKNVTTKDYRESSKIKSDLRNGEQVGTEEMISAFIGDELKLPDNSRYETKIKNKELFKSYSYIERNNYLSDNQKDVLKQTIATSLGITRQDLNYYEIARQDSDLKTDWVLDQLDILANKGLITSRDQLKSFIVANRKEVNNKRIINDSVIDNLKDRGLLSYSEAKVLKKYKWNDKSNKITLKSSSGGRRKKASRIKLRKYSAPKISISKFKPAKISSIKSLKAPGRLQIKSLSLKTPSKRLDNVPNIKIK